MPIKSCMRLAHTPFWLKAQERAEKGGTYDKGDIHP